MHKHHIIPRHRGGSNDPLNITNVTVERHAHLHHMQFKRYGLEQDHIAHLALSGQIGQEEATRLAAQAANKDRPLTVIHRQKIAAGNKGKQAGENHPMFGKHHTAEAKAKNSEASKKALASGKPVGMMGKKHSAKTLSWFRNRPKVNGRFVKAGS